MVKAHTFRQHNTQLKQLSLRLTDEMVSGRVSDVAKAVQGDYSTLAGIERSLHNMDAFDTASAEAEQMASAMQSALKTIQDATFEIGGTLVSASTTTSDIMIDTNAEKAYGVFKAVVSAINTNTTGRYLFAGKDFDTAPLVDAETLLTTLETATAGATSAAALEAAVSAWFDAPAGGGGFVDTAYLGGVAMDPVRVSETDTATFGVTALDSGFRDTLKGLAMASMLARGAFAGDLDARSELIQTAGEKVITGQDALTYTRAEVGWTEGHVSDAQTQNSSQRIALELARSKIVEADPYETATAMEAVQTQIETLYTLTARLSELSFTDYMR
ncbi:flagellin [Phaeovulum vinaykumarii]|uniref:Flagellar hook-associated protein 3 FlgL n=1 Tax=Phaeovulum vinaykumarii TaxID=407234 RepID=A0A1N7L0Y2_9RHOB|nr:flagellin [Phaeovulum vinaykumarii]SIS67508.1 flagellar hook-associated protein 3 FlgL [Phaeovulum vinaykumarii]SOC00700.1 flagellar hook-associated protein 3 FlgL [Phaeovulum vinaykumarii]